MIFFYFQIQQAIDARLMGSNKSRTFYTQAILPGASVPIPTTSTGQGGNNSEKPKSNNINNPPPAAKNMVRTDCREQKLEKFLVSKPTEAESNNATVSDFANSDRSLISRNETLPDRYHLRIFQQLPHQTLGSLNGNKHFLWQIKARV